jgi:hypothetical protein
MHSLLSLAVGYNRVVTHGRRWCNNVVAILAKDKTPLLQRSSVYDPSLYTVLGRAVFSLFPILIRAAFTLASCALRKVVGGANMTTPGGACTPPRAL